MKKLLIILIIFFCPLFIYCAIAKEPVTIRVAVLKDKELLHLSVTGAFDVVDLNSNKLLFSSHDLNYGSVKAKDDGIEIKDVVCHTDSVLILPKKKIAITIDKRRYRGKVAIYKDKNGLIMAVNILDLESYVKGVLYNEISHNWPMDAIKAQAVAVRTYAMYQKEVMKTKNFDVSADTSSQVYGGYFSEKDKTNRGVDLSEGEVLVYKGRLFPAYFHATCGGVTENASELWKADIEPLKGGSKCEFCSKSPHYSWRTEIGLSDIKDKLSGRLNISGVIADFLVEETNPQGRVRMVKIKDDQGATYLISAKDLRFLIGPDILRSTYFTISLDRDRVIFSGKGWGHGVGLCQWGAFGMAKKGYSYKEILEFYYPGAKIMRML